MSKFSALLFVLCCMVCSNADLFAQTTRNCGTMGHLEMLQQKHPKVAKKMQQIEQHTNRVLQSTRSDQKVNGVITLPVVVHVLYNTSAQNISVAQIQSQIDVLNEDFRRTNSDASNTPSDFLGVAADSEIEFCLATIDPDGNATDGITRKQTSNSSWSTNDAMKKSSQGGTDAWDTGKYLNLWVCNLSGGILGYAQFPGGPADTDGVVCLTTAFGTTGNVNAPFNLGRTTTHEVGHWLNLRHIWGDGGCGVDDFVSDTPASDGPNYTGAPCTYPGPVSCGSNDMFQNYMDYSDDGCMNLYTTGQKNRMRALFDAGGFRASLLTSNGCGAPAPPTCTDGIQNGDEEGVDCGGSNCSPCVSGCGGDTEVTVSITFDNYPEETSWSITNSSGSTVASGGTYGSEPDGSTFTEAVCLPNGCYDFTITDAYGDGICCSYGNGSYSVTDGSGTLASGGSFSSSETTNFCLGGGPAPTCTDGVQNGDETGVDCGGPDCAACPTCSDGTQNGNETGVDCGGPDCAACPTCSDGTQNGNETGVDCGGPDCAACPTCSDGVQNGDETGTDCGGSCAPCGGGCSGTEVTVSITFDNYPEETSWSITNSSGTTVASGGTYGSSPDGSTVSETLCLADGCYDFIINDAYGDGICCSYGNGSYSVTSTSGTLASGGTFGSSETTNFCLGSAPAPTCTDGVQNGSETGVDCGGSCAPCSSGGCETVNSEGFESGWGIWNDGGSDCARVSSTNSYEGSYSIRLRDNTSTSTTTTDNLNLSAYDEVNVSFYFYMNSMENGEDFWLQVSTNGGSSYTTVGSWTQGSGGIVNNTYYSTTVPISASFTSNTRLRFRCDASGNSDYVYIDNVTIEGCSTGNTRNDGTITTTPELTEEIENLATTADLALRLFPNPAKDLLNVAYDNVSQETTSITIYDMTGRILMQEAVNATSKEGKVQLDVSTLQEGAYLLQINNGQQSAIQKFFVF